ncbi:MAG: PHP domain-containing protein [Balneolaceae bacterium]|nr:PHP domain-containing protein [Balneolaceae bacterium]
MGKADLHIHSSASDGQLNPAELLRKVKSKNISTVSITDHDTIKGYLEAKKIAPELGIELIPGVEITSLWNGREIHLLAYNFRDDDEDFLLLLNRHKVARRKRMHSIVDQLNKNGVDIDYDEIRAESRSGNIGRPHAATVLINKGYVASVPEAFIRYLSAEKIATIKTNYAGIDEVVAATKSAGGIISLAHPGPLYSDDDLDQLLSFGLDGIECIHPSHRFAVQKKFTSLAKTRNLLITGGSDYHGTGKSEYDPFLGIVTVSLRHVDALKRTSLNRKKTIKSLN